MFPPENINLLVNEVAIREVAGITQLLLQKGLEISYQAAAENATIDKY